MKKNFASLAYLQNYRQLNIVTRAIDQSKNSIFGKFDSKFLQCVATYPGMQVLYTYVDNFVD